MWELILAVLAGSLVGTITGLIPGLHTNTIAILVVSSVGFVLEKFEFLTIGAFLISMVVVHSFVDYIPSIFLGAPESSTVLSVLPGHRMLAEGLGLKALKYTLSGGVSAFLLTLMLLPLLIKIIKLLEPHLAFLAAPVLVTLAAYFIILEVENKKIVWAAIIYFLAGSLGVIVLGALPVRQPLFPMLSGLFGISVLILSLKSEIKIPKQKFDYETKIFSFSNIKDGFKAVLAGSLMGLLPTLGPSQAAILAQGFSGFKRPERFLVILGGINTVDTLFTLTTLYIIGKARSGVLVVVQQMSNIGFQEYMVLVAVAFSAVWLAVYITIKVGKSFAKNIDTIPYSTISFAIILLVTSMVLAFSGFLGLVVMTIATSIGILSQLSGVKKIHAMGVLSLPVIVGSTI